MEQIELKAKIRTSVGNGPARVLRREGKVPAILYGPKTEPILLSVTVSDIEQVIKKGGIGQALALLLKLDLPENSILSLYDIAPVTPGVAKDLSHIPTSVQVEGYAGEDPSPALQGADVVLICAGVARKPGMDRSDLFNINATIIKNLIEKIAEVAPHSCIGIITNPVNTLVAIASEVLKNAGVYDKNKLFGITTLDVIRAEDFVAEKKGLPAEHVRVNVIGGHSGATILPVLSQVQGVEFSEQEVIELTVDHLADRQRAVQHQVVLHRVAGLGEICDQAVAGVLQHLAVELRDWRPDLVERDDDQVRVLVAAELCSQLG